MDTNIFSFHQNYASKEQLINHLLVNAESKEFRDFVIKNGYGDKLFTKSERFEVWSGENFVGLICAYFNQELRFVYITHVRIADKYQRNGIASFLMEKVLEKANSGKYDKIALEVLKDNEKAKNLYQKFGFEEKRLNKENQKYYMEKLI